MSSSTPTIVDDTVVRLGAVALAGTIVAACGSNDEPPPKPPAFDSPKIRCENVEEDDIDRPVVREVSVAVSDPDRDLITETGQLCGTLNGVPIALGDADADGRFTWEPSKQLDENPCDGGIDFEGQRFVCDGVFELRVTASDAEGNSTELETEIEKADSS